MTNPGYGKTQTAELTVLAGDTIVLVSLNTSSVDLTGASDTDGNVYTIDYATDATTGKGRAFLSAIAANPTTLTVTLTQVSSRSGKVAHAFVIDQTCSFIGFDENTATTSTTNQTSGNLAAEAGDCVFAASGRGSYTCTKGASWASQIPDPPIYSYFSQYKESSGGVETGDFTCSPTRSVEKNFMAVYRPAGGGGPSSSLLTQVQMASHVGGQAL